MKRFGSGIVDRVLDRRFGVIIYEKIMPVKDYDFFLNSDSANDLEKLGVLVRRLVDARMRVWFSLWEVGSGVVPSEVLQSVISRSAFVCLCGVGSTADAEIARSNGIECIEIDLSLGPEPSYSILTAAIAAHTRAAPSPGAPNNSVENAINILRGELPDLQKIKKLVKDLKALKQFGYARRLLGRAREAFNTTLDSEDRLFLGQQHALCTYKDPDQPADEKFDTAISILRQVDDLKKTKNQETLGIAGAAYKYKFETFGQKADLERSLSYYLRGYEAGPRQDFGYTSINAAYVLELLARQESDDAKQAGAISTAAEIRRKQAQDIRNELIQVLPPLQYEPGREYLTSQWWFLVTVSEAFFGLGRFDEAFYWLQNGVGRSAVEDWEFESTARQLASIAKNQADPDEELERSPAWNVIAAFLGPGKAAGVRSVFLGRVGLALSGGGFRASLFHIGVLARLAELDVLRHVEVLSCVSGGSIIGAHYYLELRQLLQTKRDAEITRDDYIEMIDRIQRDFLSGVQRNIRTRMVANFWINLKMMFLPNVSRTEYTGRLLETEIFSKVKDDGQRLLNRLMIHPSGETDFSPKDQNWCRITKVPILVLNATALNTGHNWQFTAKSMGEPPAGVDSKVDANYRLRRMNYWQAPEKYHDFPLGHAVAASAAVPGLFEPLHLPDLYPGIDVRLVDGGVHDNQGVFSLLEQGCSVMLVSDASGQMESVDKPGSGAFGTLLRSNSVLQARIRVAEYHDLDGRKMSAILRNLMFLHLKKDVEADPLNWVGCQDPIEASDEARPAYKKGPLTNYDILKDVQKALANVRTDLDSFHDIEAFALMTSGYRMTERDFADYVRGFPQVSPINKNWRFLQVEPAMKLATGWDKQNRELVRLLTVSSCLAFKVWMLYPALKVVGITSVVILAIALVALAFRHSAYPIITIGQALAFAVSIAAAYLVGENVVRVVRFRDTVRKVLSSIGLCLGGFIVAWVHLICFDKLYLRLGKVKRIATN
jgi:predicted acylesterase/phospholipase RssA